jgi:hypothetical protein
VFSLFPLLFFAVTPFIIILSYKIYLSLWGKLKKEGKNLKISGKPFAHVTLA